MGEVKLVVKRTRSQTHPTQAPNTPQASWGQRGAISKQLSASQLLLLRYYCYYHYYDHKLLVMLHYDYY